jgi:hypothetical protein
MPLHLLRSQVEIFWEDGGWYAACVNKKTPRGILFHYMQTDEYEFVAKHQLAEYARSEQLRFPQKVTAGAPESCAVGSTLETSTDKVATHRRRLEPPAEFVCGEADVFNNSGKLPSMASNLPDISTLRTWTRPCQLAFWQQRKTFWNSKKLSLLQQACRKQDVYPGGDGEHFSDQLLAELLPV